MRRGFGIKSLSRKAGKILLRIVFCWVLYYRNRRFGNGGFGTEKLAEKNIYFQKATGEMSDYKVNIIGLSMSDM